MNEWMNSTCLWICNEGRGGGEKNILLTLPWQMQLNGLSLVPAAILELHHLGRI